MVPRNTICLWYGGTAMDAAQFYARTFPDSAVGTVYRAPADYPSGKQEPAAARRAFEAMMEMTKIDIAAIEAARRG